MTTNRGGGPPRFLTWLASALLPGDVRGRSILGDLLEEWHARPPGLRRGVWYLRESLRVAPRYLFVARRLPGTRPPPGRPSGRRGSVVGRLADDVRHAARGARHHPGFTGTAVAVLALGIGVATAVFASYQAVVLDNLPVVDPGRLVYVSLQAATGERVTLTPEELQEIAGESRTLSGVAGAAAFGAKAFPLMEDGRPLVLGMSSVTDNYFQVLGAGPALGRLFRPGDGDEGAEPVAVISYEAWRRDFGGDPGVLGRRLIQTQAGRSYSVVGVAPPGLDAPVGVGYWIPVGPPGHRAWGGSPMDAVVRLAPDGSLEAARSEFLSLARTLDARRERPRSPTAALARPLTETVLGDVRPTLLAIAVAVGLLLLIACVNVGNLFLVRATQRSGEVVVRRALGAGSGDIARLLLVESVLIGGAGGAAGLALAVWLMRALSRLAPAEVPRSEMIGLAGAPVAVAAGVTVAAALLFGVVPPLVATRRDLAAALRVDGRSGSGTRGRRRTRRTLVAVQVALAVVLLFGSGLVVRSLRHLQGVDLGYDARDVAVLEVSLQRQGRSPEETLALLASVLHRIREAPGVASASWIMSRPFLGSTGVLTVKPVLEGQTDEEAQGNPRFPVEVGGGELFETLGVPVVRGRGLRSTDGDGATRVAVVSQRTAQRLWPGEDPVGRRFRMVGSRPYWWTVVGVVGETRFRALREATPTIYVHYSQMQVLPAVWTVAVRTTQDLDAVLPHLRRLVNGMEGDATVWRAGTLADHLAGGPLAEPRMSALILSVFGVAALLLAALGLYGVMALVVRERSHELGVRQALGASARRLRWSVLGDALAVTAAGTCVGLGVALALSRLLAPLLFEVEPQDPVTAVWVCVTLVGVAVLAAYAPARRATSVDPTRALRAE